MTPDLRHQDPNTRVGFQRLKRDEINPTFATSSSERESESERIRRFRELYADALDDYRQGRRDVQFPAGTYWMRVLHGVPCAPS